MNERAAVSTMEDYQLNGFAVFRAAIDTELVAEARCHVEWLQRRHPALRPEHLHHPLMRDDAFWVRLVTDDRLIQIAQMFLGSDLACFTAHYICKPPGDGEAVLWHQDGAYWPLEPMDALTVWLAIDDCDEDNGCLRMIPRTHRNTIGEVVLRSDVPNMLSSSVHPRLVDERQATYVPLRSGDVSVHHPLLIHGSDPNRSPRRRCGLDIGYIRTTTRIHDNGLYLNPILVQGSAIIGVNQYRPWPAYDPCQTIDFRGSGRWNERIAELNRRPGVISCPADEDDVGTLTAHMIERLKTGTTKARVRRG